MVKTLSVKNLEQRDAVLVGETETHQLWEFPEKAAKGWRNFYLRLHELPRKRSAKRTWWFGHNGVRFARHRNVELLQQYDPQTYDWVDDTIRELFEDG